MSYSFEQIKLFFKSIGATLLTTHYENTYNQKLDIVCPNGHHTQKTFKNFKKHGCSVCNPKKEKYSLDTLQQIANQRGDTILSKEYANAHTKLIIQCTNKEHAPYERLWNTYKRSKCRKCAYEESKVDKRTILESIEQEQYTLLRELCGKLLLQCPKNHPYETTWNRWQQGKRCPLCSPYSLKDIIKVREELKKQNLILLSNEYMGNKKPIQAKCKNNHITWKSFQAFMRYGCSECTNTGTSNAEIWLLNQFKEFNPIHRYKIQIPSNLKLDERTKSIELDIYFPEHKLAIEYCGLYWHSSKRVESLYWEDQNELNFQLKRNKYRHQYKKKICNHLGVNLLTIFEDEFLTKKDTLLSYIRQKLNPLNGEVHIIEHLLSIPNIHICCDLRWDDDLICKKNGLTLVKEIEPLPYIVDKTKRWYAFDIVNKNIIYDCGHQIFSYYV